MSVLPEPLKIAILNREQEYLRRVQQVENVYFGQDESTITVMRVSISSPRIEVYPEVMRLAS